VGIQKHRGFIEALEISNTCSSHKFNKKRGHAELKIAAIKVEESTLNLVPKEPYFLINVLINAFTLTWNV